MTMLPQPLRFLRRDRPFRVSNLGLHRHCILRLGLESATECVPSLPAGPWAEFGRAVHQFFERSGGMTEPNWEHFTRSLLSGDITAPSPALRGKRVPFTVLLPADRLLGRTVALRQRLAVARGESPRTGAHPDTVEIETEYPLKGFDGELSGKADRLEVRGNDAVTVVEYKSGRIQHDGSVRPSYLLQIIAYGLLVHEERPTSRIDLRLSGSDRSWQRQFTEFLGRRVERLVGRLMETFPRGVAEAVTGLASVGSACKTCGYRPACATYLEEAPKEWDTDPGRGLLDRWGQVESVQVTSGMADVRLTAANGRRILVTGVPTFLLSSEIKMGDRLWLFDLGGRPEAPGPLTTLHVLDRDHVERSAHFASVFSEADPMP